VYAGGFYFAPPFWGSFYAVIGVGIYSEAAGLAISSLGVLVGFIAGVILGFALRSLPGLGIGMALVYANIVMGKKYHSCLEKKWIELEKMPTTAAGVISPSGFDRWIEKHSEIINPIIACATFCNQKQMRIFWP